MGGWVPYAFTLGFVLGYLLKELTIVLPVLNNTICTDLYKEDAAVAMHNLSDLYQHNYDRPGLAHITVAGSTHHGLREVEMWLQTFAPGCQTPIHRHDCEELFLVQKGSGTVKFTKDGSIVTRQFGQNASLIVLPDVIHQIQNSGSEELQLLVVISRPPAKIYTYPSWHMLIGFGNPKIPYYWDSKCPPKFEGIQLTTSTEPPFEGRQEL